MTFEKQQPLPFLIYLAVGLVAGAVIALQIGIMRIYAVGSWAHFGSLVVSLAMLAFGLVSAVMCVGTGWYERRWHGISTAAVLAFGPLMIVANLAAQQVPFNAIFLVSDPAQKWRLAANFVLYLLPFLAGALFLGVVFLKAQHAFARVYFADLVGSGLSGLAFLLAMYVLAPENLLLAPLALWLAGALCWLVAIGGLGTALLAVLLAATLAGLHLVAPASLGLTTLAVSDYKGVSYARKFPDAERVYESRSPFGYLEAYASSYLHFAPGLSDNAAFNLPKMPANSYLGLYIDSEGPIGIIRDLPAAETAYYKYLPMIYPYLLKQGGDVFVVQFGGGLSTALALSTPARSVTVAEGNPAILAAFRTDPFLKSFTGDILAKPRVSVVPYDGRLHVATVRNRYDVIDLALADSAGLASPGGFAIVEKYAYTREAMRNYMRALRPGGILAVTLWNKEEPPKSSLKLYHTMALAARDIDPSSLAQSFFVTSSYLGTTTVLYKRGGFSTAETLRLSEHTRAMSFEEIYAPGFAFDAALAARALEDYDRHIFGDGEAEKDGEPKPAETPGSGAEKADASATLPAVTIARAAWHHLVHGGFDGLARRYVFDTRPLTNSRPYFAAYVKTHDLPRVTDRLEIFQDEWGYLLVWATLAIAAAGALVLVLLPVVVGWRTLFGPTRGKTATIVYFACLGLGYIMVEVALISHFVLALSNATLSASVLITGMLVFTGLGSFVSARYAADARRVMPQVFLAIGAFLIVYGYILDLALDLIGTMPYGLRLLYCFLLILPPAFLMGFPMPTAMGWLSRLGKEHMFIWAWGINGCFSVVGAALVPIIATSFGLSTVLIVSGCAYLLALPAFYGVLLPARQPGTAESRGT
jgi:spermidine synthase